MLVALLSSMALGVEPCTPPVRLAVHRAGEVVPMGALPNPTVKRFVTGEGVEAIRRAMAGAPLLRANLDAVHVDHLTGPRTFETALEMAGALRGIDGALRLRGGTPMVRVDGVPLRSDLE